jgi:hypothetical protein
MPSATCVRDATRCLLQAAAAAPAMQLLLTAVDGCRLFLSSNSQQGHVKHVVPLQFCVHSDMLCVLCTALCNLAHATAVVTCKSGQCVGFFEIYSLQPQSSLHVQATQYALQLAGISSSALRSTHKKLRQNVCCSPVAGCTAELFGMQYHDLGTTCMMLQASST